MSVRRFRKKPAVIEAWRLVDEDGTTPEDIAAWCGGRVINNLGHPSGKVAIVIPTLEGDVTAQYGDYVIRGAVGEFYPCKPDVFDLTYEPADA